MRTMWVRQDFLGPRTLLSVTWQSTRVREAGLHEGDASRTGTQRHSEQVFVSAHEQPRAVRTALAKRC